MCAMSEDGVKGDATYSKITPLTPEFVISTTQQLILIMKLCQELGYEEGWMGNITRKPLWRNAILYYKKHQKKFANLFPNVTVPFTKAQGISYINQCLAAAGIEQEVQGDINGAYFAGK